MERKTKKILMVFFLFAITTCPILKADDLAAREEQIEQVSADDDGGSSYAGGLAVTKSQPKKAKSWKYYFLSALGQILEVVNAR